MSGVLGPEFDPTKPPPLPAQMGVLPQAAINPVFAPIDETMLTAFDDPYADPAPMQRASPMPMQQPMPMPAPAPSPAPAPAPAPAQPATGGINWDLIQSGLRGLADEYNMAQLPTAEALKYQNARAEEDMAKRKMANDAYQFERSLALKAYEAEIQRENLAQQRLLLESNIATQNIQNMTSLAAMGYRPTQDFVPAGFEFAGAPPRKLSATEQKEFYEARDAYTSSDNVIRSLQDALELNKKPTLTGPFADERAQADQLLASTTGGTNEKALNTINLNNLVMQQALANLRSTFGAAPTEGERQILLQVQGSVNLPPEARAEVWKRAIAAAENRKALSGALMQGVTSGDIYQNPVPQGQIPTPATPEIDRAAKEQRLLELLNKAGGANGTNP
ncbi:MAG: hypothetical protein VKL39_16355 [Leptolyngbyaceae bacterium]|nr:hypothetical protein [Leptolyngbyaceae bacterium]